MLTIREQCQETECEEKWASNGGSTVHLNQLTYFPVPVSSFYVVFSIYLLGQWFPSLSASCKTSMAAFKT